MNGATRHYFEFETFRVDVEERRLLRNGMPVTLTAKDFEVLLALVENSGRTIDKNELMQTVWEDTFVEEGNLNRHISTLRKLLGDDPREQRFIKTIPKRGYRFTAAVREIVDEYQTLELQNVSRSRLLIREETSESFWTLPFIAVASMLLIGAVFLGAWAISTRSPGQARTGMRFTENAEVAEAYRRGRELWNTRGAESLHQSTLLLEKVVREDPNFALGHAALADAYAFDYTYWKKAESEANAAIKIDPSLGQPHASLGFVKMYWQWNLSQAEVEFKQAVVLSPDYATGHQWYALNLAASGHTSGALVEIKKAVELEPANVAINADYCQVLYFAKHYDEAFAQCQKVLKLDPGSRSGNQLMYDIYLALGMNDEAVNKFVDNKILYDGELTTAIIDALNRGYADGGIRGFHTAQVNFFTHIPQNSYKLAQTYARLGDYDKVYAELDKAYEQSNFDLILVNADPLFGSIQNEPRFHELGAKLTKAETP